MSHSILDYALQCLQDAGFPAFPAYPRQKMPDISEPVATAHIHTADSGNHSITVEVNILSPAQLGGAACELSARRAAEALQRSNAVCVQKGCVYDGTAQIYSVSILAAYCGVAGEDSHELGPGFQIYLGSVLHPWVVNFSEEKVQDQTLEFATRSPEAVAICPGSYHWNLRLEELFPPGVSETPEPEGEFTLRVLREGSAHDYQPCRWSSVTQTFTAAGLRRICKGIALTRKEAQT